MVNFSYARQLKTRLGQKRLPEDPLCMAAECWGMAGPREASQPLVLTLNAAAVARRAFRLLRRLGCEPRLEIDRARRRGPFRIQARPLPFAPEQCLGRCPQEYLLGAFLAYGSLTAPDRGSHLEIGVGDDVQAAWLTTALAAVRIRAKVVPRRGGHALYLKGRRAIIRFLAAIGAHEAVLEMENLDALKAMKNRINRLVNSETANLHRTVISGWDQAQLLTRLYHSDLWATLPPSLTVVALMRMQHPDWSLREIGRALKPPLSKSAVNHRMRRVLKLALQLEGQDGSTP